MSKELAKSLFKKYLSSKDKKKFVKSCKDLDTSIEEIEKHLSIEEIRKSFLKNNKKRRKKVCKQKYGFETPEELLSAFKRGAISPYSSNYTQTQKKNELGPREVLKYAFKAFYNKPHYPDYKTELQYFENSNTDWYKIVIGIIRDFQNTRTQAE